jgi:hypothetical protein
MDDVTVLEALAAHVRAKTPPAGRVVKKVFAYPVESISGALPAVVLYSGSDSVEYGASNRRRLPSSSPSTSRLLNTRRNTRSLIRGARGCGIFLSTGLP